MLADILLLRRNRRDNRVLSEARGLFARLWHHRFGVEITLQAALAYEAWIGKPKIGLDCFQWNVGESAAIAQILHVTASLAIKGMK